MIGDLIRFIFNAMPSRIDQINAYENIACVVFLVSCYICISRRRHQQQVVFSLLEICKNVSIRFDDAASLRPGTIFTFVLFSRLMMRQSRRRLDVWRITPFAAFGSSCELSFFLDIKINKSS